MPKEPEKPGKDASAEGDEDRPTVNPSYDPSELARSLSMRPSPPRGMKKPSNPGEPPPSSIPTPLGLGAVRPPSPTLTDPEELEAARQRSAIDSSANQRRVTPVGALSLANARVPSNLPPKRKETLSGLNSVDAEWDELATTPPPPDVQALVDETARQTPTPDEAPSPPPPPPPPDPPITEQEMNDRVSVGDFSGALLVAERLLAKSPDNQEASDVAKTCRTTLKKMYRARIGQLDRVPVVSVARDQMRWLSIDHRAGFVLSLIDGVSTVEMILDVTGMPELDALRILSELVQQRIISFRQGDHP